MTEHPVFPSIRLSDNTSDPSLYLQGQGIHNSDLVFRNYGDTVSSFVELFSPFMFLYGKVSQITDQFVLTEVTKSHNFTISSSYSELITAETTSLHRHEFFEITYILSGTLHMIIEGQDYYFHENDCCVCNKNIRHVELHDIDCEYFLIMLQEDFLKDVLKNEINDFTEDTIRTFHPIFSSLVRTDFQKEYGKESKKEFIAIRRNKQAISLPIKPLIQSKEYYSSETLSEHTIYIINSLLIAVTTRKPGWYYNTLNYLCQLLSCFEDTVFYKPTSYLVNTPAHEELFIRISRIIESHHGNISRSELEHQLGYTGDHLTRIIHKYTGMNFIQYAQKFSLLEAERLLTETTMSVSDICMLLGYSNRTYFYQIFKGKYGLSPKEWRMQIRPKD